jgi:hypothetical protein
LIKSIPVMSNVLFSLNYDTIKRYLFICIGHSKKWKFPL